VNDVRRAESLADVAQQDRRHALPPIGPPDCGLLPIFSSLAESKNCCSREREAQSGKGSHCP
jgi:hypothetical protein